MGELTNGRGNDAVPTVILLAAVPTPVSSFRLLKLACR